MIVFANGISGSNRKKYLEDAVSYSREKDGEVILYSVGEEMKNFSSDVYVDLGGKNILNLPADKRALAAGGAFERIINRIGNAGDKKIIINSHLCFVWEKVELAIPWQHINKIDPDVFVTIIDFSKYIEKRLLGSEQWKEKMKGMDCREIRMWQGFEQNLAEGIAQMRKKKHYVISANQNPSLLYKIMFKPEIDLVYFSHPITYASEEGKETINRFYEKLENYFAVINPEELDVNMARNEKEKEGLEEEIRERDLRSVKISKKIIGYDLGYSPGYLIETKSAKELGKDVYVVSMRKGKSPFERNYTKEFSSEQEFFDFLKRK